MSTSNHRLAYVCSDPGIPLDGTKGASVHFRSFGGAMLGVGVDLDTFMVRAPRGRLGWPRLTVVERSFSAPRSKNGTAHVAAELSELVDQGGMLSALRDSGPHAAVYERYSLFGLAGVTYARAYGLPYVLEVNAPLWLEAKRYRSLQMATLARAAALDLFRQADVVLTVSGRLRALLVREGIDPERVTVFPNGIDASAFETPLPARRPAVLAGKPLLVFVGSLKPWHGIEFLLEAVAKVARRRPVGLWVVGDGPLRSRVEKVAEELPGVVVSQGPVSHHEIPSILAAADVAVAPYLASSPSYFCPLKVVEALASGRPLLASRVPAVVDLLDGREIAHLHAPADAESFGRSLDRILDERSRTERMADEGRELARREYTWGRRVQQLHGLLGWTAPVHAGKVSVP